jgi:hypothetical protein
MGGRALENPLSGCLWHYKKDIEGTCAPGRSVALLFAVLHTVPPFLRRVTESPYRWRAFSLKLTVCRRHGEPCTVVCGNGNTFFGGLAGRLCVFHPQTYERII